MLSADVPPYDEYSDAVDAQTIEHLPTTRPRVIRSSPPSSPEPDPSIIGKASEIPRNGRKFYTVNGESIAVLDVDGVLYAVQNSCPHLGGPVGEGKVFGSSSLRDYPVSRFADFTSGDTATSRSTGITASMPTIACPWHGWEFDLADGTPRFPAKRGLKTYPIRIEDGS